MSPRARGSLAALPDAVTAAAFFAVWVNPFVFGPLSVKTAALTMLVEFVLIHATGVLTGFLGPADDAPRHGRWQRRGMLAVVCGFYLLMIAAFAWSFGAWWPFVAFAWLVVGKVLWARRDAAAAAGRWEDAHDSMGRRMAAWAGSVVAYLGACFATIVPPVPRWGMTVERQPDFGLAEAGGGLWIDEPHRVVAMGVLYFSLLAAGKFVAAMWQRRGLTDD